MSTEREAVKVDVEKRTVSIPHLGITLRVILGAAAAATSSPEGTWTMVYQRVAIGTVELKKFKESP